MYHLVDKFAPFPTAAAAADGEERIGPPRLDESQRIRFPAEADHTATKFGSAESAAYAAKMRQGVGGS